MSRLSERLMEIIDDFEEEIVVVSLLKYYDVLGEEDSDLKWAIDLVLQDYMEYNEYNKWLKSKSLIALQEMGQEFDRDE